MSVTTSSPPKTMTAEELMALPEDGIRREIIRGQLRERPMTTRNWRHSELEARLARMLGNWLEEQSRPRGKILCGEVGFRLRREPETLVGIDVAYASAELAARTNKSVAFCDGPPVLAVEILSPSDKHEDIVEKVRLYPEVGTVVWVVDPDFETVCIHRPGQLSETFNTQRELAAEPYLPGFRLAVAELFAE